MIYFILDCEAPYNIDIFFDKINDKGVGAATNTLTSCGKLQFYMTITNFMRLSKLIDNDELYKFSTFMIHLDANLIRIKIP